MHAKSLGFNNAKFPSQGGGGKRNSRDNGFSLSEKRCAHRRRVERGRDKDGFRKMISRGKEGVERRTWRILSLSRF